jgi:4,5-DOPA dioxygenase extradiol
MILIYTLSAFADCLIQSTINFQVFLQVFLGGHMSSSSMPVIFVGHGSPMNAIEENQFSQEWEVLGKKLPQPKAIVCVSAHWETVGTQVTAMQNPRTIHDFGGFPRELFEMQYSAPGNPALAATIADAIKSPLILPDEKWGLDHGTWSVLCRMYPDAKIPVIQFSLDHTRDGEYHYNLGQQLSFLRDQGVLIIGSGNMVHNLRMINWNGNAFDWAIEFDEKAKGWLKDGNHEPLIHYQKQGQSAALAINSAEHFLPLLYVLGAQRKGEQVKFFNESVFAGSISMRGLVIE